MLEEVWEGSVNMRPLCSYKYIKQAMPREKESERQEDFLLLVLSIKIEF